MDLVAGCRTAGSRRRGLTLILAAIIAALTMATAASAQAANIAKAWGNNVAGELGYETTEECGQSPPLKCSTTPMEVSKLSGVTAVAGGSYGSLALLEGGTVRAWGSGGEGQLGNGTTEAHRTEPVAVCAAGETAPCANDLGEVGAISAGYGHRLALLKNGTVVAWGSGGSGDLGDGTTTNSDVPVAVCAPAPEPCPGSHLSGVTAIAAGDGNSLALLSNGTVMAWGRNLGNGGTETSDVPVAVTGLSSVTAIAAGDFATFSLAVSNGKVMAWGQNGAGELGDGTQTQRLAPVEVSNLSGVTAIAAGSAQSLALLGNGTVKAWGSNYLGQLGDGTSTGPEECGNPFSPGCSKVPVAVCAASAGPPGECPSGPFLSGVTALAAGDGSSMALLSSGAVMAWGTNAEGQLGDGTSTGPEPCNPSLPGPCSTKPVPIEQRGAIVRGIGAGQYHDLAFGPPGPPANLPEVGRCVKVAVGTGKYSGAACLTLATKTNAKKYEWMPVGVTEKPAFLGSGLETTLTTAGHSTIKCLAANFSGEWTGPKTASVNVEFQACTSSTGAQCQTVTNPNNKSEILLKGVLGELGFIRYEEVEGKVISVVGLDLKPQPPMTSLATYECTGSSQAGHIEGSVIGKITPINKMTTEQKLLYYATKAGEQRPEAFQGAPKDTLITSFTEGLPEESKGSGASSLNIKGESGNNAAPLEIKAK
jgi:alpha-tubulin suppressor-like RCC1 family protein